MGSRPRHPHTRSILVPHPRIRARQRLGKYRVERRLAQGGFSDVFQAYDTIEGIRVALKVPRPDLLSSAYLEDFRSEVRLTARLEHPNVLPIKNAEFVDGHFIVVSHLGDESLADRLKRRLSFARALSFSEQILAGLAHAHSHAVLHCDVKPDNLILFGDQLRLTDFGISKVALRTLQASGSGTIGFMAPEQAMGRPSLRSDVFAAGLILYRMFSGTVPEWPFEWPPPGFERIRRRLHPDLIELLQRSLSVDPRRRYADAGAMLETFEGLVTKAERFRSAKPETKASPRAKGWREVQLSNFRRKYRRELGADHACRRCERPVSEAMVACPWCGASRRRFREETRFPAACKRCKRGVKLDWTYCAWCYGGSIGPLSERSYSDKRYSARCARKDCRGELMPFMRYCPWCRTKVRRPWKIKGKSDRCGSCGWGVLPAYWSTCPWCATHLGSRASRGGAKRGAR